MRFTYATLEQHSSRFVKSAPLPFTIVAALIVGLSPFCPMGQVQAQKESGVIIANKEAALKPGYKFRRVSSSKLEVVRESEDPAKREAVVAVAGAVYCSCQDPKTELIIFCDTVISHGKASCASSSKCTCTIHADSK